MSINIDRNAPTIDQRAQISRPEFIENVAWNHRSIESVRSTCSCLSGSFAGILGLTNLSGIGFYLASLTITNSLILIVNWLRLLVTPNSNSSSHPQSSLDNVLSNLKFGYRFWSSGLIDNAFGFILWWTLFYGSIHIYD